MLTWSKSPDEYIMAQFVACSLLLNPFGQVRNRLPNMGSSLSKTFITNYLKVRIQFYLVRRGNS